MTTVSDVHLPLSYSSSCPRPGQSDWRSCWSRGWRHLPE